MICSGASDSQVLVATSVQQLVTMLWALTIFATAGAELGAADFFAAVAKSTVGTKPFCP